MSLDNGVPLQGELLFKCFHKRTATSSDSVFRVQFPSTVVQDYAISFSKNELDDAFKGKSSIYVCCSVLAVCVSLIINVFTHRQKVSQYH